MKLSTSLIPLLITFYIPAFAEVIESDNGSIALNGKDALYAVENGVVLSSEPEAKAYSSFDFVLLFDKRVWDCSYVRAKEPNEDSSFVCFGQRYGIINRSF